MTYVWHVCKGYNLFSEQTFHEILQEVYKITESISLQIGLFSFNNFRMSAASNLKKNITLCSRSCFKNKLKQNVEQFALSKNGEHFEHLTLKHIFNNNVLNLY